MDLRAVPFGEIMNSKIEESLGLKTLFFILFMTILPIFLTQCRTVGGSYQDIEYDPNTLKTPDGHGMVREDYPFDDEGKYRRDWVKSKDRSRARSSYELPDPEPADAAAAEQTSVVSRPHLPTPPPPVAALPAVTPAASTSFREEYSSPVSNAVTTPAMKSATYHKVESGDTLYSIARRHDTSVTQLKKVNGLTSDIIRVGQSLRLP